MNSAARHTVFVEPQALAEVKRALCDVVEKGFVSAGALIDCSGMVLASAGNFRLPDDEMGATAAAIFSAIRTIACEGASQDYRVQVADQGQWYRFIGITDRLFLFALSCESSEAPDAETGLQTLIERARSVLAEATPRRISSRALKSLSGELEKLFSSCKNSQ
jgi:hypothetical protein